MVRRLAVVLAGAVLTALTVVAPPASAVVGGSPASAGQFPYQAAVLDAATGRLRCSGVLVRPTWVVTSAHCVSGLTPAQLVLRIGSVRYDIGQGARAVQLVLYPGYSPTTRANDLAMLRLGSQVTLTPVTLPAAGSPTPAVGTRLRIAGWGSTMPSPWSTLMWADVPVQSPTVCGALPVGQFCAGGSPTPNACGPDLGGPAVVGATLRGLISVNPPPCTRPSGYLDVARYVTWILAVSG